MQVRQSFLAMLATAAVCLPTTAQPRRVEIPNTPTCATCSVTFTHIATIGRATDSVLVGTSSHLERDSRGRYYVSQMTTPGVFAVYDSTGRLLRTVGRIGQGPGEFDRVVHWIHVGPGDTIFAFDSRLTRTTVYGPDLTIVRTMAFPRNTVEFAILPNGGMVVHGLGSIRDPNELPLHLLDPHGQTTRSFGASLPQPTDPALADSRRREVTVVRKQPDQIWAARLNTYEIERWDTTGRHLLTLVRRPDWFRSWTRALERPVFAPPQPTIGEVREDAAGRLWVWSKVPDAKWLPPETRPSGSAIARPAHEIYDSILEVLDPTTGTLVLSMRVPGLYYMIADNLMVSEREDEDGIRSLDVWRTALRQR